MAYGPLADGLWPVAIMADGLVASWPHGRVALWPMAYRTAMCVVAHLVLQLVHKVLGANLISWRCATVNVAVGVDELRDLADDLR